MDTKIVNQIKRKLEALATETARELGERDRPAILIERSAETCEQETLAVQRDMAVQSLGRNSERLRAIRAALTRIRTGEYGRCMECETPISEPRLRAVPWASHCRSCQERLDRDEAQRSFRALRFAA